MLDRVSNLEKTSLTNVDIGVDFICNLSFHKWSRSFVAWVFVWAIALHTNALHTKERFTFFPQIHTHKTETKKTIKIKNPKNSIETLKKGKKKTNKKK
jgi:hypothetical protein